MKKFIKTTWIICFFAIFTFKTVRADELELERIIITSSRVQERYSEITRQVDVITSDEIKSSCSYDLSEVLGKISSLHISDYGGLGATKSIRMRGSTAAQVLVLVDGRPINSPRDGQVDLSLIPLEHIDHVEVLHGASSHLYGSGALGATVNIITKNPPLEKQHGEVTTSFGTFRTYLEHISYGGTINEFGYIITGDYKSSEGYRENSAFNSRNWNAKFKYEFNNENKIILNSGFYKSNKGAPGSLTSPDSDDKQKSLNNFLSLDWEFTPDTATLLSVKVYNNYDRLQFVENTAGSMFDTAQNIDTHTTCARGYDVQYSKKLYERYSGTLGLNYVTNLNNSSTSGKHGYFLRAAYIENQVDLTERLKIHFGARVDDYSNFGSEVNPSGGFIYTLNDSVKLRSLISRSFRAPTFNDLYWPDQGWVKGNENLKPEKGICGEIGVDAKVSGNIMLGLTYYRNDYNDLINWGEEGGVWTPKNIDSAIIDGIDFKGVVDLTDSLSLKAGYSFLNAKNDKTSDYLIYHPKHKFDFTVAYEKLDDFTIKLNGQFLNTCFHDPQNTIKVKGYFLLGLDFVKKINDSLTFFISIDNLLNEQYQVIRNYPTSGFTLTSSLKFEF